VNTILLSKYGGKLGEGFSKREKIDSMAFPGRRHDGVQTAATFIADLSDTRTAILLCSFCQPRFNFRKNKYRAKFTADPTGITDGYLKNGQCEACGQMTQNAGGGKLFIAEDYWEQVSQDPGEARANARMAWKGPTWRQRIFGR